MYRVGLLVQNFTKGLRVIGSTPGISADLRSCYYSVVSYCSYQYTALVGIVGGATACKPAQSVALQVGTQ